MHLAQPAQSLSRRLGCDVTLWRCQQLKADHEFSDCRRSQQRRIEMSVEMNERIITAIGRLLMKAQRVRKLWQKKIVVSGREPSQGVSKSRSFLVREFINRQAMLFGDDHYLKRPNCPKR